MGKVKPGVVKIIGKMGDYVYVDSKTNGYYRRKASPVKSKKRLAVLKKHNRRNEVLNKLASELNNIIRHFAQHFKSSSFYHDISKLLRRQENDNRYLLLSELRGVEINPTYPIGKLGLFSTSVGSLKNTITISLQITSHPSPGRRRADCYCYEVIWVCWCKGKKEAVFTSQHSDWIMIEGKRPLFEFIFEKPAAAQQWLFCVKAELGVQEKSIGVFAAQGMQITDVGSFDKKDLALANKAARKIGAPVNPQQKPPDVVRVKPKTQ